MISVGFCLYDAVFKVKKSEGHMVLQLTFPGQTIIYEFVDKLAVDVIPDMAALCPQARLISLYFDTKCYQEALQLGE